MKRGDLVILTNSNPKFEFSYGYSFDRDLTVWVPNGTIGMYCEDPSVDGGKIGVLVNERVLWFDQLDSMVINETR
jgi:hypothetical protein